MINQNRFLINKFIAANQKLCDKIEPYLSHARTMHPEEAYELTVAKLMNAKPSQVVVDVGGGKSCRFAKFRNPTLKTKIIGVDISEEELQYNIDIDEKRVANIMLDIPFEAEEVDLIASSSVLEHLENVENFVANSRRVLKEGGYFIHVFPSKFAPFALINRSLPGFVAQKVLYFFWPERKVISGFPAFYNRTHYSGISRVLRRHNFEIVCVHLSYYQSPYFKFLVPLFLVSAIYEMLIRALGVKDLAAYMLIVARKK